MWISHHKRSVTPVTHEVTKGPSIAVQYLSNLHLDLPGPGGPEVKWPNIIMHLVRDEDNLQRTKLLIKVPILILLNDRTYIIYSSLSLWYIYSVSYLIEICLWPTASILQKAWNRRFLFHNSKKEENICFHYMFSSLRKRAKAHFHYIKFRYLCMCSIYNYQSSLSSSSNS